MKEFNDVVRENRKRKFPELIDAANATNKPSSYWSDAESTSRGINPTLKKIREISKLLKLNFVIMSDENEPVRAYDDDTPIPIQKTSFSEKDFKFLEEKDAPIYVKLARLIKKFGAKSEEVEIFLELIEKENK